MPFNSIPFDEVKCAGMPKNIQKKVNFDEFNIGLKMEGKLIPKLKKDGVRLEPTTYELKPRKLH